MSEDGWTRIESHLPFMPGAPSPREGMGPMIMQPFNALADSIRENTLATGCVFKLGWDTNDQVTESARAHNYFFSEQVQETCNFGW